MYNNHIFIILVMDMIGLQPNIKFVYVGIALLLCISCSKNGLNSLLSTQIEPAGTHCRSGGLKINYGLDKNENDVLDANEIQNSSYVCNGDSGIVELDNLIRIPLGSPNFGTCDTTWAMTEHESFQLHDFNKLNYPHVSSILFVPSIYSLEESNTVTLELYNVTDSVPIANTQISSNVVRYIFKYSGNIYNDLPDHAVTLCIRVKNSRLDICGQAGFYSYLYILRE